MSLVRSPPGFASGALPVLLPIPGATPSHSILLSTDRPFQAKALASLNRRCATTLLPEQPKPAQAIMTMVSPNPQFSVGLDPAGSVQFGAGQNS
jgi:hypothetical protein